MDKIKITNHQFFSLTASGTFGGVVIVISAVIVGIAKQDAWISALMALAFGLLIMWLLCFLGSKYPGMTYIQIIVQTFGKWIGFVIALSFVLLCIVTSSHMPWYISTFVTSQAMPQTPAYVIAALFVAAAVIAVLYGIEAIVRASEILIYIALAFFTLVIILVLPSAKIENILPIFENGIAGSIKGALILSNFMTFPLITILMLYPVNTNDLSSARKSIYKGFLLGGFFIFVCILMSILVLGTTVTARSQYPTYQLAKEVNVGIIFSRLEFIIAAAWITTFFFIFILFFYAAVMGLSQLLGLKEHKRNASPLGLIVLVMSQVVYPSTMYESNWLSIVWPLYITTYALILPIILLIVFWTKKLIFKRK